MQPIIKDIILSISDDVVSNLTQSFEKTYYGKMNYSSKNTILDSDNKLLKETIGFEIAFIHVITYFLAYSMSCSHEYMHILNILDNFEKDIRLKACLISDDFLENYDSYFLENHVNFLCCNSGKEEILTDEIMYYYLGLLNSKLINYVFISKSGNTQVSANELNLLPFSKNNVKDISAFVSKYLSELREHQEELDRLVCEAYDLSVNEINMILDY